MFSSSLIIGTDSASFNLSGHIPDSGRYKALSFRSMLLVYIFSFLCVFSIVIFVIRQKRKGKREAYQFGPDTKTTVMV